MDAYLMEDECPNHAVRSGDEIYVYKGHVRLVRRLSPADLAEVVNCLLSRGAHFDERLAELATQLQRE